jgi:hypothetical protein
MHWIQSVRWLVLSGVCVGAIATACGGDGNAVNDSPGSAGKHANAAGQASGDAGAPHQNTGGSANQAGSATGGTTPASAGVTNGMAGDSTGMAGQPPVPHASMCQEACKKDGDCLDGYKCQNARCVSTTPPPAACKSNDVCKAQLSGWTTECTKQGDCLLTQECVDIGEKTGRCATKAGGAVSCATLQQDEVATKNVAGDNVKVCGKARAECGPSGACREVCSKTSCPNYFACNDKTGECECDNDKACANQPNVSRCMAGRCVCAGDGDCTTNANKCSDGVCSCSDASVCKAKTAQPGTTWVCQ